MEVFTIGFTKKSAEQFFELLKSVSIEQLVDIRLNNVSQLAGFSKRDDLAYFLQTICNAEYIHEPMLAPTQDLLDQYKKSKGSFADFEKQFLALMKAREIENKISPKLFEKRSVLLCSEETAAGCHRKLVVDYLNSKWGNVQAKHL
ncbi:MAG: DUF488 domain-containing protein [Cyanobacteria bacterium SZAS LIN-3]|nr:DUF488 domain-containing protein [Cyanobacteria bacterium SZAS LIN-3]MBS2008773.1 DUF488 domain-containing protein [Cyanobacteria bacterium SZAS TMP-1]